MKFNPNFLAIFAFLVIGLIWSGGHVGWIIAMGVLLFLSTVALGITEWERQEKAAARKRFH